MCESIVYLHGNEFPIPQFDCVEFLNQNDVDRLNLKSACVPIGKYARAEMGQHGVSLEKSQWVLMNIGNGRYLFGKVKL